MADSTSNGTPDRPLGRAPALWRRAWQWVLIIGCSLAALVLGYIGFWRLDAASEEHQSVSTLVYLVLQLFTVQSGSVPEPLPWELDWARFLALGGSAGAAIKGLAVVFRAQIEQFRLRRMSGHVVIVGLGRKGTALVEDFRRHGDRVVAIELDEDNDNIRLCPDFGAIAVIGDATEEAVLRKARVEHAKHVVAITGDDGVNVTITVLAYQLVDQGRGDGEGPLRCSVHIVDAGLCTFLAQQRIITKSDDPFDARIFNVLQDSARLLLREHPLDRVRIAPDDPRAVHLVVIGLGQMGESVVIQAARMGHYANGKRLRITVIDKHADQRKKRFYQRHPQFDSVCTVAFVNKDAEDPQVFEDIRNWASDEAAVTTVAVCLDSEPRNLSCVLGILAKLGTIPVPVLVRMTEKTGPASLFAGPEDGSPKVGQVYPFGMIDDVCTRTMLLNETLDRLARKAHEDYVTARLAEGKPASKPALQPWERLAPELKESNRQQIDHVPVKLRAVGCYSTPTPEDRAPAVFTDQEVEVLARMEHARWAAERWLSGWTLGPKDPDKRLSPYLVDWDRLPDDIKEYDRQAVRDIPHLLGLDDKKVYRQA